MRTDRVRGVHRWLKDIASEAGYSPDDIYFYILLLSAPLLLTVHRYFGEAKNFTAYFPKLNNGSGEVYSYLLEYLSFFILVLVIPLLISTAYNKSTSLVSMLGFSGLKKNLLWTILALIVLILPSSYQGSTLLSVQAEYPLPGILLQNQHLLPVYFLGLLFLYYLPWEFFFRGFLLFGLKNRYGTTAAILIQTISSCLVHIGKPAPEILGSIPFGIVFGIIAVRTKNLWIVVLLHAALGIFTDIFLIYQG